MAKVSKALTPSERSSRARQAALTMHSMYDSAETSKAGRDAAWKRFEREVDPEGKLRPAERQRRAKLAQRAHMTKISRKAAKARRRA